MSAPGSRESSPHAGPAPERGTVDLWRADLKMHVDGAEDICSAEELQRASRFMFAKHRKRYMAARGALRRVLGRYLNSCPAQIRLAKGAEGKPELAESMGLRFNISHCDDEALIAISRNLEVGVDLELDRQLPDALSLARRFFATEEVAALESAEPARQVGAFFDCWTRKEACLKATGLGLTVDTRCFSVGIGSAARTVEIVTRDTSFNIALKGVEFDFGARAFAAVAVIGDARSRLELETALSARVQDLTI